ncbi:MAG: hypothetical protein M0C28_49175 [Candidatus Moduliflexus flocculans]|nr:hypothetical protein [Candidatus Moduliflexus flocculans]
MDPEEARVPPPGPHRRRRRPASCPASRIVSAGNCFCCLWIVGGAALAVNLLAKRLGRRPDLRRRGHRRRPDRDRGRRRRRRRRHPACGRSTWSWPRRVLDKAVRVRRRHAVRIWTVIIDGGAAHSVAGLVPAGIVPLGRRLRRRRRPRRDHRRERSSRRSVPRPRRPALRPRPREVPRRCGLRRRSSSIPNRTGAGPASAGARSARA